MQGSGYPAAWREKMPQQNSVRAGAVPPKPLHDVTPQPDSRGAPPPAVRAARPSVQAVARPGISRRTILMVALCIPLVAVNIAGVEYYLASLGERVRHPMHAWLRPSGYVGQSAGIVAFVIFFFLWLYPLRKKWKALRFTGSVGKWLDVHVASALLLPLLLVIHAAWRS